MTTTAVKTSVKKWICILSNLIASIWSCSICQMPAMFPGVEFLRILIWFKKRKEFCSDMSTSSHPRRPRGSQSGREKRRDESFQVWAKEPLGTNSHRTISKNSCRCRLLIGHKKCFVLLYPIGEQFFSWVRTRRLLSHHTCQVRSPSLCVQGKLLFSTFLTRNERTTDQTKKRLGCYQQEQFNLPREYSVFDSSQYIVNNRKFKMRRWQESQIRNSLTRQKKALPCITLFCTFLCRQLHDYPWKCLIRHVLWRT